VSTQLVTSRVVLSFMLVIRWGGGEQSLEQFAALQRARAVPGLLLQSGAAGRLFALSQKSDK
jgi:hypothetical protein